MNKIFALSTPQFLKSTSILERGDVETTWLRPTRSTTACFDSDPQPQPFTKQLFAVRMIFGFSVPGLPGTRLGRASFTTWERGCLWARAHLWKVGFKAAMAKLGIPMILLVKPLTSWVFFMLVLSWTGSLFNDMRCLNHLRSLAQKMQYLQTTLRMNLYFEFWIVFFQVSFRHVLSWEIRGALHAFTPWDSWHILSL